MKKTLALATALLAGTFACQSSFGDPANDAGNRTANPENRINQPYDRTTSGQPAPVAPNAQPGNTNAAQPAAGHEAGAAAAQGQDQAMDMDREFVREAASGGMFEVQAGQLAEQRSTNPEVKQFAQKLVQDHTQANQQLTQIAKAKGIEVPQHLLPVHQAMLDALQKHQGSDFDKHFIYGNVADHVKDILEFRDASQELQDPQLKQFAQQTLPKLHEHLQMAQRLAGWNGAEAQPASGVEHGTGTTGTAGHTNHVGTAAPQGTAGTSSGTTTGGVTNSKETHEAPSGAGQK